MPAGSSLPLRRSGRPHRAPGPSAATVPKPPADAPPGLYLRSLLAPKSEPVGLTLQLDRDDRRSSPRGRLLRPGGQPAHPAGAGPLRGRGARRAGLGQHARDRRRQGTDGGRSRPQRRHLAGQGAGAEERRAAGAMPSSPSARRGRAATAGRMPPLGRPVAAFKGSEGVAILPAGRYLVRVEQGLVRADRSVVVPVGSQGVIDVPLNAARLQLSAVGKEIAESAGRAHLQRCRGRPGCTRAAGARWRDRRRGRPTSCWRRGPTT